MWIQPIKYINFIKYAELLHVLHLEMNNRERKSFLPLPGISLDWIMHLVVCVCLSADNLTYYNFLCTFMTVFTRKSRGWSDSQFLINLFIDCSVLCHH